MKKAMAQLEHIESNMARWFAAAAADKKLPTTSPQEACELLTGLIKMEAFWPRLLKGKASPSENEKEDMATKAVRMFLCYFLAK